MGLKSLIKRQIQQRAADALLATATDIREGRGEPSMQVKLWMKGLVAAAIGGLVSAAAEALNSGGELTAHTFTIAAAGAITGVAMYLKQSPLPK